jgi:glycosyltransferase involved in cell wall biosynthesis
LQILAVKPYKMEKPKISLLLYTYNRADIVVKAIDSILNQTYRDFELVLINNGSTDNTHEVLEKYRDHEKVRVIHVAKNLGSTGGMNFALDQIQGEWFATLGDDDVLVENAFETMMQVLVDVDPTINAITSNAISTSSDEFTGKGLYEDQYLPLEKIILKTTGDFFAITKTALLGDHRLNEDLPGDCNVLWYKIDDKAKRYYIHKGLKIYNNDTGENESTRRNSINYANRIKLYKELLKEDFYWSKIKQYNKKQYLARCLRGMYFLKATGDTKGMRVYYDMLRNADPDFKSTLFSKILIAIPDNILKYLYQSVGNSKLAGLFFRVLVKRYTLIGQ